jgi:hypothetical protein
VQPVHAIQALDDAHIMGFGETQVAHIAGCADY